MNNQKKYDFVIYGASGFTGKLVVEYALSTYLDANSVTWALAGRNLEKLNNLKKDLNIPSYIDMLEVDSTNQQSIDNLVSRTKCVLTTVGPYQLYGEKIIRTCIKIWCRLGDSNSRPDDYKSTALPTELSRQCVIVYIKI